MNKILILNLIILSLCNATLVQVFHVFRHGARFPEDDRLGSGKDSIYFGELIPSGMRQHYNLGQKLREEYINEQSFLRTHFNHTEFYIVSTDVNRTLQSAQSQLLGLYPDGPQLPEDLEEQYLLPPYQGASNYLSSQDALPHRTQVFPIHPDQDILKPKCKNKDDLSKRDYFELKTLIDDFENKTQETRLRICQKLQTDQCNNLTDIHTLYDVYISQIYQGKQEIKIEGNDAFLFQLMSSFQMYYNQGGINYSRSMSFTFYTEIMNIMREKIRNPESHLKWVSYSAHEANLIRYAKVLNITGAECLHQSLLDGRLIENCYMSPEFAANLIFELHFHQNEYFIKVKYNGEYQQICGADKTCPFEEFVSYLDQHLVTKNEYKQICLSQSNDQTILFEQPKESLTQYTLLIIIFISILVTLGIKLYSRYKKNNFNDYQLHQVLPVSQ